MPRNEQVQASEIAQIKRAVKDLQQGRLKNASMHGTRLYIYDDDGDIREVIGNQGDGSYGSRVVKSPPQPTPTAPVVPVASEEERVPNVFPVEWDGGIVQGQLPVVHGRTDVWTQKADSVDDWDPELAKLAGSIRDQQGGATSIVVEGSGTYLVALQMVGADRVTKGDFSEPSLVEVSARVDAEDIEDRLNAFADGELPDGAYDNLMARLGEFLHVRADQIDVNSLAADAAFIGYLEAAGIVLSNEAGRRRFEVSGDGFRLTDTETAQVVAQLGTQSDDLISLHDSETGDPVTVMSQDGGVSARHVSSEGDPHIGGKPLAGDVFESPRWFSAPSVMESLPQGIIAHHLRTFSSSDNTNIQSSVAVAHLEARLVPGRLYRIGCDGFEMGSREPYFMEAFYTSSSTDSRPGMPHSGSVSLGQYQGGYPPSGGNTNLGYETVFNALTTRRVRLLFAIGVRGGGGKTFGDQARNNARFYIEDLGPSIGLTGRSMLRSASTTSNIIPEIPEAVLQRYQVAGTATYSFDSSTGEATRQYIGGTPRFGEWTHTGQTHFTVVQFEPWDQAGTPTGTNLQFRVERWGSSRGHVVRNWLPDFTGLPSSFNLDQLTQLPVQRNVGSAGIRAADLTREQEMDLAGRSNGSLVLGGPGWGAPNYAGAGVFTSNGVTASLSTEIEE